MRNTDARHFARLVKILADRVFREREILQGLSLTHRGVPTRKGREHGVVAPQGAQQASP
jgi:hypothetical protein